MKAGLGGDEEEIQVQFHLLVRARPFQTGATREGYLPRKGRLILRPTKNAGSWWNPATGLVPGISSPAVPAALSPEREGNNATFVRLIRMEDRGSHYDPAEPSKSPCPTV